VKRPLAVGLGLLAAALLALLGLALRPPAALAQEEQPGVSNESCLACHADPNLTMRLQDGSLLSLRIDPAIYAASVHGQGGYACVQCHTGLRGYPHPSFQAADRRDLSLKLYGACQFCHSGEYERTLDSVHERARAGGVREAAVCTDCHGAHDTRRLTDPLSGELLPDSRAWIPQTCARCHNAIYAKYKDSVHGAALLEEGNPDVPTCIDCHGVHSIEDPRTSAFRLNSPQLCAGCHTDPQRMDKYGISTQVLATYVADFHGTTVTLFEKQSPDAETNKPVCFDCHGVHDIRRTDDPVKGLQVRENLLARCRVCHPDATANFPDAWLSHYTPSAERHPLVFAVDTFYKFFIPGVLGGMGAIVALDASWRMRRRLARRRRLPTPEAPAPASESTPPEQPPPPEPPAPARELEPPAPPPASETPTPPPDPGDA
jgi:predicted CXXCH cytochrome family protein